MISLHLNCTYGNKNIMSDAVHSTTEMFEEH